jgi:hypothetical protein
MSKGTDRVRLHFNPGDSEAVSSLKGQTAALIDECEGLRISVSSGASEVNRLVSLAQTAYEEACMWAVKAATY